jgi:Uncharacterized protein conserved in bacteria
MQCPLCLDSPLEPKFVGATEVDICPKCRGIWLDRGELDRLLGDAPPRDDRRRDDRYDDRDRFDDRRRDDRYDDRRRDDRSDDRDRYERDRRPKGKKSKAKRLADLFEEVLDF